jgi:hypothetical protein
MLIRRISARRPAPALNSADVERLVVAQIYDLAALTMGATRDAAEIAKGRGRRAARLGAIKADIAEKLTNPSLSVQGVANTGSIIPSTGLRAIWNTFIHRLFTGLSVPKSFG